MRVNELLAHSRGANRERDFVAPTGQWTLLSALPPLRRIRPILLISLWTEAEDVSHFFRYGMGMAFLCFTASYVNSWRAVVIATSAHLFFVAILVACNIPESPRFLMKNRKDGEARQVR